MSRAPKILDQVRNKIRLKHYARKTEKTYVSWIKRYILFHKKRHPKDMGVPEIETFLNHLAVRLNVAASTQNQAFNALIFLYKQVLGIQLEDPIKAYRAKRPVVIPTVLTKDETYRLLSSMSSTTSYLKKNLNAPDCVAIRFKMLTYYVYAPLFHRSAPCQEPLHLF